MKPRPVLITWLDATTDHGWADHNTQVGLQTCYTLGFLTKRGKEEWTVASTAADGENTARIGIPPKWIKEVIYLDIDAFPETRDLFKNKKL